MPPYSQLYCSPAYHRYASYSYYSDDDDNDENDDYPDADSTYTAYREEDDLNVKAAVRAVRFSEEHNTVHVYPGASTSDYHCLWYSQEEEDAFLMDGASSSSSTTTAWKAARHGESRKALAARRPRRRNDDNDIDIDDSSETLSTALLLGKLVVHGVVLRAVLLGHEIVSQL